MQNTAARASPPALAGGVWGSAGGIGAGGHSWGLWRLPESSDLQKCKGDAARGGCFLTPLCHADALANQPKTAQMQNWASQLG